MSWRPPKTPVARSPETFQLAQVAWPEMDPSPAEAWRPPVARSPETFVAGAGGGALAGELIGGDVVVSHLGPIAEPFGQGLCRNLGRVVGGAVGAVATRCLSVSPQEEKFFACTFRLRGE